MSWSARFLLIVVVVLVVPLGGCPGDIEAPPLPPPTWELEVAVPTAEKPLQGEAAPHVVLALVIDDREDLLSCACPDGVVGGLARRASLLASLEREVGDVLAVAGPGSLAPPQDEAVAAAEAPSRAASMLEIHRLVGMDLVAIGAADVALFPSADLATLARGSQLPLLATNLRCVSGGCETLRQVVVVETPGGTVAVLSLTDPSSGPLGAAGYEVVEPARAVGEVLATLAAAPDAVVAFCDASPRRLEELARSLQGVDFLVGSALLRGQTGVQLGAGVFRILQEPGSLQVGLLDLVFLGAQGASFVDAPRLRDVAEQRLASYGRRARLELSGSTPHLVGEGDPSSEDRVELLGRQLTVGATAGHVFGFKEAPVLKIYPEQPDVAEAIHQYLDGG